MARPRSLVGLYLAAARHHPQLWLPLLLPALGLLVWGLLSLEGREPRGECPHVAERERARETTRDYHIESTTDSPELTPLAYDLQREIVSAARSRRWILPEVAPMGPTLMYTWVDTQTHMVRAGARSAGAWVLDPLDIGRVGRHSVPRIVAKTERALLTYLGRRQIEIVLLSAGGIEQRARVRVGDPSGLPPQVLALSEGWGVFFIDAGRLTYVRVSDAGEVREIRSLLEGGAFAVAARDERLHVTAWQRVVTSEMNEVEIDGRFDPKLVLNHTVYTLDGRVRRTREIRRGHLGALETLTQSGPLRRLESRVLQNALCLGPVDSASLCRRERTLFADVAPREDGQFLLVDQPLSFRNPGVRATVVGRGFGPPTMLDAEGIHPRMARAGEDLFVAIWSRPDGLRVALLAPDGSVRHQADLQP